MNWFVDRGIETIVVCQSPYQYQWVEFVTKGRSFAKRNILSRRENASLAEKEHKKSLKQKKLHENPLIRTRDMAKSMKNDHILVENRTYVLAWMLNC